VPRLSCCFIRASLAYLVAGFTLGALMLTLKAVVRYEGVGLLMMTPHVEFLLIGWTVQLTMGVAFWILPRFEGGTSRGAVGYAWLAFVLLNAGVIFVWGSVEELLRLAQRLQLAATVKDYAPKPSATS